jgi:hypothetical protein
MLDMADFGRTTCENGVRGRLNLVRAWSRIERRKWTLAGIDISIRSKGLTVLPKWETEEQGRRPVTLVLPRSEDVAGYASRC